MRDDYRQRSPGRDRDYPPPARDHHDRDYRSRHDHSQSPTRHQDHHRPRHGDQGYDSRGGGYDDRRGHRRDDYEHREPPRGPRADDYSRMYDEDQRDPSDYNDRDHRDSYNDRRSRDEYSDRGRHDDYGRSSRRRDSRSRSPKQDAGKPTDTVILEGLPFGISQHELRDCLLSQSIAAEYPSIDVRISASRGQRRAFIQFQDIDSAAEFVREHFPSITIKLQDPTDEAPDGMFHAYVHFARNRDEPEPRAPAAGGEWTCPKCAESNFATRSVCRNCGSYPSGLHWQESLTGAADAGEVPSHMLVIYPLAGFVNENMLAKDIKRLELEKPEKPKDTGNGAPKLKSTAPTNDASGYGARAGTLHRVFLMRETESNDSLKYGFAEFWSVEDAAAALTKFSKSRNFTVAACAVTISSIHMGVFIPEDRAPTDNTRHMSFHPLFNPSLLVRYRDHHAYPSVQVVNAEPPAGLVLAPKEEDAGEKTKKRKADTATGSISKKPTMMVGKMAMWQRKHDEIHVDDKEKNKSSTIKIALSGANAMPLPSNTDSPSSAPVTTEAEDETPAAVAASEPTSFVDRERLMCLICMRKYKSTDEVDIHEKSRNHRTAMEDSAKVEAALPRLAARDKRLAKTSTEGEYRDRAKERRQAFNQPNKPKPVQATAAAASKPKPVEAPKPAAPSKGAGMLAKMGWASGSGLGADGAGRTEVIETNAYQEGVGLGAEGGNLGDAAELAAKRTTGNTYAAYVSSVQDRARERYNKMND